MRGRKFVRRVVCLMFVFAMMMTHLVVQADIIFEPEDDFYRNHREECDYLGRGYLANGAEGYVTAWESPDSKKKVNTFENGTRFYVSFSYTTKNGDTWGINTNEDANGWIPMEDLALIYDNISFMGEHEGEFSSYNGELNDYVENGTVLFWSYPGSGVISSALDEIDENLIINITYTDADGRQWGYVRYYRGNDGWICLSAPADDTLPSIEVETVSLIPPSETIPSIIAEENEQWVVLLLVVLVVVVVAVTAILIRVFWKKRDDTHHNT